jgi:hypothetical protein
MTMTKHYGMKILMNMFGKAMVNLFYLISSLSYVWQLEFFVFAHNFAFFVYADIIEDLYSPQTAAMDFVNELVRMRGKGQPTKVCPLYCGDIYEV